MALTIKDIAKLAGVSYGTVSRVLNNRPDVNPKTREQVLRIMNDLGYQPNAIARSLVTRQTYTIALMVPDISSPFFGGIALAVDQTAYEQGYNTMLYNTRFDNEVEHRKLQFLQDKRVDGIILKPASESSTWYEEIDLPCVLVSQLADDQSCIDIANEEGGELAGEHLGSCGYRRVAYFGGDQDALTTELRLKGFRRGLARHGVELDLALVRYGAFSIRSGYHMLDQLMREGRAPDSVFCANDLIALGVMQRADEAGLDVPMQLGVVGFDDGAVASLPRIRLTTVAQPVEQLGNMAVEMLLDIIRDPARPPRREVLMPSLVVRHTTRVN